MAEPKMRNTTRTMYLSLLMLATYKLCKKTYPAATTSRTCFGQFIGSRKFRLTTIEDRKIKIWEIKKSILLKELNGHTLTVSSLAALPDHTLASGSIDASIKIWE